MEKHQFSAEIGKVLNLMIHSLYTNKDIFLRELISNASDACDKLRYLAIETPKLIGDDSDLKITVSVDKDSNILSISDNGIGMNKDDLINCLGTIATSGTQKFLEAIASQNNSPELIGQFGVGFYSAFMVASKVEVISKKAGEKKSYIWQSSGDGTYEVGEYDNDFNRGTIIKLHLKPEEIEFAEKYRLRHIISTYSDHISFPIILVADGQEETANTASALWSRNKSDITEEQYNEFYHHVAHLPDTPWMKIHTKAEGMVSYTSLIFIPSMKPFDLFHPDRKTRVKLYVKKVFISEDNNLIPNYLRFLRGVVDSEDLPLNISRETLQHNQTVNKIKKSLVKKILGELKTRAKDQPDDFNKFWNNFGEVMKEGLCEPALEEKEQLLEVCRFYSTHSSELTSLDDYVDRMIDNQENIFYITGDKLENLRHHPQLEGFSKRGIEVLLLEDHVDDFWVNVIPQYKNKELANVNSAKIDLNSIKELSDNDNSQTSEQKAEASKELLDYLKSTLSELVKDVSISHKLVDSPSCLAVPAGAMSIRMERYLIEQKQLKAPSAKILEINPNHPILLKLKANLESGGHDSENSDIAHIIFDQACILEGEPIRDPSSFARRLNHFLKQAYAA